MRVMKFGRTSVGTTDRVLVVASAVAGVTNLLVYGAGPEVTAAGVLADVLKIATKATL